MSFIDIKRHRRDTPIVKSINLALTDELRAFIDRNCGDGTLFATPSEFLRDVLREKKERMDASSIRDAIIEGYKAVAAGRVLEFKVNLRAPLTEAKRRETRG